MASSFADTTTQSEGPSVKVASGDALDVREFTVQERMSSLFVVTLVARSHNPSVDFDAVVGRPATFSIRSAHHERTWSGLCNRFQQIAVEEHGLSTYHLNIVPDAWLLTQRRNHRMFQQQSELDVVLSLLSEWHIHPVKKLSGTYKKRKYRVQYGESDYAFMSRMLEDAGMSFYFEQHGAETRLVLADAPQANEPRAARIAFRDKPTLTDREHVTGVRIGQQVKPGRHTVRDHDYRLPSDYKLLASAEAGVDGVEQRLEQFHYAPGAFLFGTDKGESTPHADDRGKTRTDEVESKALAQRRLEAERGSARVCTFETNALDLAPGVVMGMLDHPHMELGEGKKLLIVESAMSGTMEHLTHSCEARDAAFSCRPELVTPKPTVAGVESATVVGPKGEEIHTDEFGRVRVHFHWDRESKMDERSSCWIHVSEPWGGAGYGGTNLPRVGQEVLVDFLGGDPDRPIITGRVFTNLQKTPYKLPENKTQSGWKSNSTGGGGGYNEIMFEDSGGKELVRMQAEKDLHKLVKNDEEVKIGQDRKKAVGRDDSHTVGRDRTRRVKRNESVTIGGNRTKRVAKNEQQVIGLNQSVTVGVNRATQVGAIDSTIVGDTHVVMVSPPGEFFSDKGTSTIMKNKRIVLDTGAGASISMIGNKITLSADMITLKGKKNTFVRGKKGVSLVSSLGKISVKATKKATICGSNGVTINSLGGDVVIDGVPMVRINAAIAGAPAARVDDFCTPSKIISGSSTVLIGGITIVGNPFKAAEFFSGHQQGKDVCALMSTQGIVWQATGINHTEAEMQQIGTASGSYTACNGTTDEAAIMTQAGIPATQQNTPSLNDIRDAVRNGKAVIVGLDARPLWGDNSPTPLGHAIRVTGVEVDASGNPTAFYINDTGNGTSGRRVDAATFQSALDGWQGGRMATSNNPMQSPY